MWVFVYCTMHRPVSLAQQQVAGNSLLTGKYGGGGEQQAEAVTCQVGSWLRSFFLINRIQGEGQDKPGLNQHSGSEVNRELSKIGVSTPV